MEGPFDIHATLAKAVVDTVHEPLLVLDRDLRVVVASRSFYTVFKIGPDETQGKLLYDLSNGEWDIAALRLLLDRIVPASEVMEDFEVEQEATAVPAGTVSFLIRNQGPTTHEVIFVRTDRAPDRLPLQSDGLTVDEEGPGIKFLEEVEGLDIDDRQTLVLDLAPGHYVLYCNLEGHYLGGMYEALTVR